jgi:hypothetical protein
MKLPSLQAYRPVVVMAVTVVVASFFAVIIIATQRVVRARLPSSSLGSDSSLESPDVLIGSSDGARWFA